MHDRLGSPRERLVHESGDRERDEEQLRQDRLEDDLGARERLLGDHGCATAPTPIEFSTGDPTSVSWLGSTCSITASVVGSIRSVSRLGATPNTSSKASTGANTTTSRRLRSGRSLCSSRTGPYAIRWYDHSR